MYQPPSVFWDGGVIMQPSACRFVPRPSRDGAAKALGKQGRYGPSLPSAGPARSEAEAPF